MNWRPPQDWDSMDEATRRLVEAELTEIYQRDGELTVEAVVEFARNPNTTLHRFFTWDDREAAEAYYKSQSNGQK